MASAQPPIVSAAEWQRQRDELLVLEKQATREQDALAAKRRRLPMVEFDNSKYEFATPDGPMRLLDFFGDKPQLALYQFMDRGPGQFCPGCTYFTAHVAKLDSLLANGVAWRTVSDMPLEQMQGYWVEKGWNVPFASSHGTTFAVDCGTTGGFLLNMFFRDGDRVFRTYSTTSRGVDRILFANNILDLAPYGRQEEWEDSPEGWPQGPTYG